MSIVTHQKSESCHCGAWISVEGDEGTVLASCEAFRFIHSRECRRNTERDETA
jgi:hypothetical protein